MDRGSFTLVIVWMLFLVSAIFLGLRVYCRLRGGGRPWWDDWVMIVALFCAFAEHLVCSVAVHHGLGRHVTDVAPANMPLLRELNHVVAAFAILSCAFAKTSWALTMLRIVRATRDCMRVIVWFLLVSVNVLMDLGLILNFLECDGSGLTASGNETACWTHIVAARYNVFAAVWSSAADFVLALLAWAIILPMQMTTKDKVGVAVAMGLGIVSGSMGFAKTANIFYMAQLDLTYDVTNLMIWSAAEVAALTMAASVPFIRLFVRTKLTPRKANTSGVQGLSEGLQDKTFTSSSPTTVESSRPSWRGQSGDSELQAHSPRPVSPEAGVSDETLDPHR